MSKTTQRSLERDPIPRAATDTAYNAGIECAAAEIESDAAVKWICNAIELSPEEIQFRLKCIADKVRRMKK